MTSYLRCLQPLEHVRAAWDLQTRLLQSPFSWHFGPDHSFFFFLMIDFIIFKIFT